jgi:formylglycine-generating enzyme required for sulfatase activity
MRSALQLGALLAWWCLSGDLGVTVARGMGPGVPPSYGHDFATIGAVGNTPYLGTGPFGSLTTGRGGVSYEYRVSRTEITTSQWMEFLNTFSVQPVAIAATAPVFPWVGGTSWGAIPDASYTGPGFRNVLRTDIPNAGQVPVLGVTWNMAALYCNWLHHDKTSDWATIQNGAYDASGFSWTPGVGSSPRRPHNPEARYWIPTLDEWMKAAYYDPNRYGHGQEGWWTYMNRRDRPPIPGLPGQGESSAQVVLPGPDAWYIPVGAYVDQQSPWGLWDTSGGAQEWLEDAFESNLTDHLAKGTVAGDHNFIFQGELLDDAVWNRFNQPDWAPGFVGLRVASAVPSPSVGVVMGGVVGALALRRRR